MITRLGFFNTSTVFAISPYTRELANAAGVVASVRERTDLELIWQKVSYRCTGNPTGSRPRNPWKGTTKKRDRKKSRRCREKSQWRNILTRILFAVDENLSRHEISGNRCYHESTAGLFVLLQPAKIHLCSSCVSGRVRFRGDLRLMGFFVLVRLLDSMMQVLRAKGFE